MKRAALRAGALGALLLVGCSQSPDQSAGTASPAAIGSPTPTPVVNPSPDQTMPTIQIKDKHGTVSIGRGAVDLRTLHVPIFPGATQSSGFGSFSDSDANGSTAITTLDAHAPFEAVDAWYIAHVPPDVRPIRITVRGDSTASYEWISVDGTADRVVTINSNQGNPIITISVKVSHRTL
ncbi:MAG TPA: hypothetical protein VID19_01900 [Candidatus Eremiobacteraceae bacterium]